MIAPTQEEFEVALLALLLDREAENQTYDVKQLVGWTVRNRVLRPGYWDWGTDWISVMTKPWQYSSLTHPGDLNSVRWPKPGLPAWQACLVLAGQLYDAPAAADKAEGCTHYYDVSMDAAPPPWAAKMVHQFDAGRFHFYRTP